MFIPPKAGLESLYYLLKKCPGTCILSKDHGLTFPVGERISGVGPGGGGLYGSCTISSWFPLSTSNREDATASSVGGHQSAKAVPETSNSNVTTKLKSIIPMISIVMSFRPNPIILIITNPPINVYWGCTQIFSLCRFIFDYGQY
jgi:hypothetical protein